jgi:hypothetical protein
LINIQQAVGSYNPIQGLRAGKGRWWMALGDLSAETGGNAGSDFALFNANDAGTYPGACLKITRATGNMQLNYGLSFGSVIAPSAADLTKHIALWGSTFGFNIATGAIQIVSNGVVVASFTGTTMSMAAASDILLGRDPTNPLHATTKQYVDARVYTLPTASTTVLGGVKVDGTTITIDGTGKIAAAPSGISDAPSNGNSYMRNNAGWSSGGTLTGTLTGVAANFSGLTTLTGGLAVSGTIARFSPTSKSDSLHIDATSTPDRAIYGSHGGIEAWGLVLGSSGAVTSGNAGLDFALKSYTDAGGTLGTPLAITRSNGAASFNTGGGVTINAAASTWAGLYLNKPASGQVSALIGQMSGANRWAIELGNNTAEGSGNAGSDFQVDRYDNAGGYINSPFTIARSNGSVVFAGPGMNINSSTGVTVSLNKSASGQDNIVYGATGGSARWSMSLGNATVETGSGSNNGSDYALNTFTDGGGYLNTPLQIKRSSNVATFAVAIVNGPSDRTLKENIEPITGALDKVLALDGVRFNFIGAPEEKRLGLIAQDTQPICPEVIQPYQTQDAEGRAAETKLAIDYPQLVAVLIEAVKTLTARVEQLEAAR